MTWTTKVRRGIGVLVAGVLLLAGGIAGHAQENRSGRYVYYGNSAVRIWQNYQLASTDGAREVLVVGGDAYIDGEVSQDVHVILGNVQLGSTAIIDGMLMVVGGDVTIAEGAIVRRDLAVFGGVIKAPASFRPGGSHIIFGAESLGRGLRALAPWVSRGLLWGRLIVPGIPWVWGVVFTMLIVTLAIALLLHRPVGASAAVLSAKPFTAFMTGLLVLLLAGPLAAVMAATIVGIALVPFLLCALIVAWVVGKVGVSRWIGDTVLPSESESRLTALRSVAIGFAVIALVYMVPILGLITWAMVGVFGLGAATLAFTGALRRERPARPPKPTPPPPPPASAMPFAQTEPSVAAPPFVEPPPPPPPPPPPMAAATADLRGFPHAQFVDRLAAVVLDVVLLALFYNVMHFGYRDEPRFLFAFLYFVVFWAWKGTSLGGIICNLRLTRVDGYPLRFSDALVRGLVGIFSICALGLGFLWILRDPQRQAWHDRVAGTFVVKVPRDWPLP
jgi:uncharacterized RDD family membrane protein YckC